MKTRLSLLTLIIFGFFFAGAQNIQKPTAARPIEDVAFCGAGGEYVKKMNDSYEYYRKNKVTNPTLATPYSFMPLTTFPSSLVVTCGSFNLYYEDDFIAATTTTDEGFADPVLGSVRKNTLCAVLSYIESVIDIQGTLDIFISQSFTSPGNPYTGTGSFLAFAGPSNPAGFSATPGIYNGHFFNHATTGTDPDVNNYDMEMTVNFHQFFDPVFMSYTPITYYDDYTNTTADCAFDLYTVLLHEITHGMGFISFVSEDNTPSHLPYNGNNMVIFNNAFTKFDERFLYKGDIFSTTFTKVVTSVPDIDASIGSTPDALRQNDIWLYNTANPLNQPVYSGNWLNESSLYTNWPMAPASFMSHMDYDFSSFSGMAQYSPGYQVPYVMGPYVDKEEFRREWPVPEIRILTALGYALNPTFSVSTSLNGVEQNWNLLANNSPAFRSNPTVSVTAINNNANFTEQAPVDYTIINNNTPTSTVSVLSIGISTLANTSDNNGDVISIMPGTLYGIRGVTSGGDNHNLLSVNAGSTIVTYTPVPGYRGLAQFGFYLWDGRERGAYKTITIDVQQGTYVPTVGQELAINGSFEDGTEVRQRLGPNASLPLTDVRSGYEGEYFAGTHFSGGQPYPYISNWWGPYGSGNIVYQSAAECYYPAAVQGRFGSVTSSANNPGSNLYNPDPLNTVPNNARYLPFFYANSPYFFNLQDNMVFNNFYQVEFDVAFSTGMGTNNGDPFFLTLNAISNPVPNPYGVTVYQTENISGNVGTVNNAQGDMFWQHVVYTFQYCSNTPANQLSLWSSLHRTYLDNFSIRQVINPPAFSSVSAFATPTTICAGATTSLSAMPDNNSCIITYTWNPGNITGQNITVSPASTTVYTVTATDGVTTATAAVTVSVSPVPTINVVATATSICAGQSVTLTASGANSYYWNPLAVNDVTVAVSPTITTTYYITGTDINGCSSYTFITITVGSSAAVAITPSVSTICSGQTATLTASGVSTYTWDNGANTTTIAVSPTTTTVYTVNGTDSGGCSGSATATVIVNPSPSLTVSPVSSTICAGQSTTLTVSGASTYTWDTGATTSSVSVSPTTTTVYTVTGTDANGCTASITSTVYVNPAPNLTLTPITSTICAKQTQTLIASGASTYSWSTGATTSSIVAVPFATTVYTVIGTDANGCSAVAEATVVVIPTPTVLISPPSLTLCAGETTTLNASGAVTYTWSTGATTSSIVVSPIASTLYSVTGTGANGCTGSYFAFITVNTPPSITITPLSSTICAGQSATLTASGASTYTWSTGATTSTISVSPAATTIYTVIGTAANGCTATASATVFVLPTPTVSASASSTAICVGQCATLTATGASTYTWMPGSVSGNTLAVCPGTTTTYTVTGAIGSCTSTSTITVYVMPIPTIGISASSTTVCSLTNATLTASGGTSYTWQPGSVTGNPVVVSPSSTTIYTVTGVNAVGCTGTNTILLTYVPCTCTTCVPVGTTGTITSSVLSGAVYCINVPTVTIVGNVTFANCEVKMSPSVSIVVAPGSNLTFISSHIYSCMDMWKGIVVQNGGRLTVRSSLFEDAMIGVDITNNTQATTTPPVLNIVYSTFNRNKISVLINNYAQTLSTYPFVIENSLFTCRDIPFTPNSIVWPVTTVVAASAVNPGFPLTNVYINNSTYSETSAAAYLKNPYPGQKPDAALYLNNVGVTLNPQTTSPTYYEFKIGGTNSRNIFDNQLRCVRLVNSNFSSLNNVYQNTGKKGIGIDASSDVVHNCRLLVLPNNNTTGAGNNSFVDCERAIQTLNYFEHDLSFCDVRTSQVNALPTPSNRIGFYLKTNRYRVLNASKNSMYNLENAIIVNATYGPYNLTGPTLNGQYAGKINVNQNLIRPQLPSYLAFGRYVSNAITLQNVSGSGLVYANSLTPLISASNNTLINVYRGIYYVNWKQENIAANTNSVTLISDPSSLIPSQYGIKVATGTSATFKGNSIKTNTVTGYGTANPNLYGILTVNTGDVVKSCNHVSNLTNGIEFDALNPNTSFSKNFMSASKYGYVLNWTGIINTQGSYPSPQDNQWTGTWTGNYKTATINSSAQNSKFYIRTASNFNPNLSGYTFPAVGYGTTDYATAAVPPTLIVPIGPILPSLGCPVVISTTVLPAIFTPPSGTMTPIYEDIALKQLPYYIYPSESNYINQNELYRILKADPTLRSSSPVLMSFYNANTASNFDLMDVIETDIANGNYNVAASNIAFFSPQNTIESNYKDFYTWWLTYQLKDMLLPTDNAKLFKLAEKCPFSDGMVVYQARALYNIVNNTFIAFEGNCAGGSVARFMNENSETASVMSSFDAVVFPNPGNGNLNISLNNFTGSEMDLIVKDVSGRTVYSKPHSITNGFTKIELDVRDGIYFLIMVNKQTNEQLVKKFVVEK